VKLDIVLVDDDAAARRMMRRVVERLGYVVHDASDGRAGVNLVRAVQPAAVLLDLRMPGELSGVAVAAELRGDESTSAIPIIVVSASTHADAKSVVREVGCDAFIEKPVDFDELAVVLARYVGTPQP
jgi:CheY-like chemotaxis protein